MILAGDIGGTNTRLALFERGTMVGKEGKFLGSQFSDFGKILQIFLAGKKVDAACFAVAGPVRGRRIQMTNLHWVMDADDIEKTQKIPKVWLLNDLAANAYGLRTLTKETLFLLHEGEKQEGNQGLMSAGTGLGEAGLFWNGKEHLPFACEGGHTDFAPRNGEEIELLVYLQKKFGHVSYERVVSGPGLVNIFNFLIDTGKEKLAPEVKDAMAIEPPSRVISDWGKSNKNSACARALNLFVSIYGAEAGNMALKFLAIGGFYLGGGIAPNIVDCLRNGPFYSSFIDKGRFKDVLSTIPIWVDMNEGTALQGAAYFAERNLSLVRSK